MKRALLILTQSNDSWQTVPVPAKKNNLKS